MKKIPTLFDRDWAGDRSRVVDVPNPAADWVFRGEGVATRKLDGTSCLVRAGAFFKRRELKAGQAAPPGFEAEGTDAETGKTVGWVPVGPGPEDAAHREGFARLSAGGTPADGTYELLGPKVQGNLEGHDAHVLVPHAGAPVFPDAPRSFAGLAAWLAGRDVEGLVFHHPDGRMTKIKLRDFGLKRPGNAKGGR